MKTPVALVLAGLAACIEAPPGPDGGVVEVPPQTFDVGTLPSPDDVRFIDMPAEVEAMPGSQGGFHVNLMYRLPEGGLGQVTFAHQVRRLRDGRLVSRSTRTFDLGPTLQPSWTSPAPVAVFICPPPLGVDVIGEAMTFDVTASTPDGTPLGTGHAEATFRCSSTAASFCASICKG